MTKLQKDQHFFLSYIVGFMEKFPKGLSIMKWDHGHSSATNAEGAGSIFISILQEPQFYS